ncbi:hypothetical protein A11A3_00030 [Alcanivorax hongdengensis A-11-3]|uniref:Hydrazine synthase alpha subunit middle domain-containing protein n=2 Tax=Alcanivorax hongdengensis TaxID=519051 RepID=L0WGI7_9GAMM|nr:hypothetical protein A11A3_00030 [Alcanivorax hongdengensis A-11-3]
MPGLLLLMLWGLSACGGLDGGEQQQDPTVTDIPVAYVQRALPRDQDGQLMVDDLQQPAAFQAGARLMVRDFASPRAEPRDISTALLGAGHDIRDLSLSSDGQRLLFAARAPAIEDADEDEQPTWNLWEYDFSAGQARRLISSDLVAEEGQDRFPRYLPDGRIVFASTRQRQARARLLDEGKPQFTPLAEDRDTPAFALHVMNADGSDIQQITFNVSHDLAPLVAPDGRIVFLRWEHKDGRNRFDLYRVNPDGSQVEPLYGAQSHDAGEDQPERQFLPITFMDDGRLLVATRPRESRTAAMLPVAIDVDHFIDRDRPLYNAVAGQAEQSLPGPAVSYLQTVSRGGRMAALRPMGDGSGRYLMAWSPCRMEDGDTLLACTDDNLQQDLEEAPPAFGLWILDPSDGTQLPVVAPRDGVWITDVAVAAPTTLPAQGPQGQIDDNLADDNLAEINIRSVYDFGDRFDPLTTPPAGAGTLETFRDPSRVSPDERRVRFLRITKGVLIPGDEVLDLRGADFGRAANFGMREIVGYVPVEPDGSVRAVVPANAPVGLQLVDATGKAVYTRHTAWLTLRPGEQRQCTGCHQSGSDVVHGRASGEPPSINAGAPLTGSPFPNTRSDVVSFADAGETMAEALTRLQPERRLPNINMQAFDAWTDPAPDPATELALDYADLNTDAPADAACQQQWQPECRIVIHYQDHIQPIWDLPRQADVGGVMEDVTCSSCHNRRDAANALQVPPAQLELTGDPSPEQTAQPVSYRELLFNDNELELVDGALVDRLEVVLDDQGQVVYQTDDDGEPVLDNNGDPIPVTRTVPVNAVLRAGRARDSQAFFSLFEDGGSHQGWLSPQELRLLAEWIDLGAQLYNDPFRVPQN